MEVGTVTAAEASTGSRTMADLALAAGDKFSDRPALRHKVGEEWVDTAGDSVPRTDEERASSTTGGARRSRRAERRIRRPRRRCGVPAARTRLPKPAKRPRGRP